MFIFCFFHAFLAHCQNKWWHAVCAMANRNCYVKISGVVVLVFADHFVVILQRRFFALWLFFSAGRKKISLVCHPRKVKAFFCRTGASPIQNHQALLFVQGCAALSANLRESLQYKPPRSFLMDLLNGWPVSFSLKLYAGAITVKTVFFLLPVQSAVWTIPVPVTAGWAVVKRSGRALRWL